MYKYNDGRKPGGRYPSLWIVGKGQIHSFDGKDIHGVVRITSQKYNQNGKWSSTDYMLDFATGYAPVYICAQLHGRTWEQNTRWEAYAETCQNKGVSFEVFNEALKKGYPKSYERMVTSEEVAESLNTDSDTESIEVSTFCPSKKAGRQAIKVTSPEGKEFIIEGPTEVGTKIGECAVLTAFTESPGFRGGVHTHAFEIKNGTKVEVVPRFLLEEALAKREKEKAKYSKYKLRWWDHPTDPSRSLMVTLYVPPDMK